MFCKNCGKELADGTKFCGACGTPVSPATPQVEPAAPAEIEQPVVLAESVPPTAEASAAPAEETPTVEAPAAPAEETPATPAAETAPVLVPPPASAEGANGAPTPPVKRRGKSGMVVLGVGAVLAVVVVVVLFQLLSGMMGGGGRTQAFAYLNDDFELMYLANLKEKTETVEVSDEANTSADVQFSADGKILYFRDNKSTLYKIAVSELKKDGRPERISRDVYYFNVLKTGNVLFVKSGSSGNQELNCYTGTEDFRISKAYDDYELSEDHKTIYYTERDEDDGTCTLYKMALKKDAQKEELLDGATSIYTDYDASLLVYGEDELNSSASVSDDADRNTLAVYSCKPGGEATKLMDDLYDVYSVEVDGGKVSFYYTIEELDQFNLYELVSDSQASADAAITAETLVYPYWSSYYPNEVYYDGTTWQYYDDLGGPYPIDSALLVNLYGMTPGELTDWMVHDVAYQLADERYTQDQEEYNAKYEQWDAANSRNYIRESLKNETYTQRSFSLYQYSGSAGKEPIASDMSQSDRRFSSKDGIFLYKKAAGISGGKVCDISDLSYYGDIYDYLNSGSSDNEWYQNVGGSESVFKLDEEAYVNGIYVLSDKEVALIISEDGERRLDSYKLDKTGLTYSANIAEDDFQGVQRDGDTLYFFTDVEETDYSMMGDFTRYKGGKTEVIAKEVCAVIMLDESGTTYVATDVDSHGVELALLKEGKPVKISDEVEDSYGAIAFLDAKQLLYIADSDLYLWDGKENRRVAKDVEHVWCNAEEDYTSYSPD